MRLCTVRSGLPTTSRELPLHEGGHLSASQEQQGIAHELWQCIHASASWSREISLEGRRVSYTDVRLVLVTYPPHRALQL